MVITVMAPMDWMSLWDSEMCSTWTMLSVLPAALWAEKFRFIGEETSSETWLFAQVTKPESGTQFCVQTIFS